MKRKLALADAGFSRFEAVDRQPAGPPDDLRACLAEQTLIRLALEAVQTAEWQDAPSGLHPVCEWKLPRPLFATILIYSYAAGVLGSRDIEILAEKDSALRYLCRPTVPTWDTLRIFRRRHVRSVTQCLAGLLEAAWKESRSERFSSVFGYAAYPGPLLCQWRWWNPQPDFTREAEQRVTRAIQADSMAMDE
jgi:hypothetical protein